MSKVQSPLLGYNNNFRYKDRVFHIQTEDSGVKYPHIITHLFADGGRIIKSVKTSYAEHVGRDGMSAAVKEMMKQQHRAMIVALRGGEFDAILDTPASTTHRPNSRPTSLVDISLDAYSIPSELPASGDPLQPEPSPSIPSATADKPRIGQRSVFGENLDADRSLDDAILSYLAKDLSSLTPPKK